MFTFTNVIGVVVPSMSKTIAFIPFRRDSASAADLFCCAIISRTTVRAYASSEQRATADCSLGQVRVPLIGLERALPICLASTFVSFFLLSILPSIIKIYLDTKYSASDTIQLKLLQALFHSRVSTGKEVIALRFLKYIIFFTLLQMI